MACRSVFLLKSPLQFINALEACDSFNLKREDCLLLLLADRKSLPQILDLIREEGGWWGVAVIHQARVNLEIYKDNSNVVGKNFSLGGIRGNALAAIIKLRLLAKKLNFVEKVFVGDLGNPLMRHFTNLSTHEEVIVLDDGTGTFDYVDLRERLARIRRSFIILKKVALVYEKWLKIDFSKNMMKAYHAIRKVNAVISPK